MPSSAHISLRENLRGDVTFRSKALIWLNERMPVVGIAPYNVKINLLAKLQFINIIINGIAEAIPFNFSFNYDYSSVP